MCIRDRNPAWHIFDDQIPDHLVAAAVECDVRRCDSGRTLPGILHLALIHIFVSVAVLSAIQMKVGDKRD